MKITLHDVEYVAALARLDFSPEEKEEQAEELNKILEAMETLNKINVEGVEPLAHVLPLQNVLREDALAEPTPREKILANAPESDEGMFRVPRIV